ncbi:MAG: ABC transporter ATP-binding protein [SAR324 cluster bacterium]|nr:ABC transporter ATP-binding protein [SAR324 cluster bacterium]
MSSDNVLEVKGLTISLLLGGSYFEVVRDVSFSIAKGESIGILGESGCGKSLTGASLLRVLPHPFAKVTKGEIFFKGEPLHLMGHKEFNHKFRWREASMIFQESSAAINPVVKIGKQFAGVLKRVQADFTKAKYLLKECGLPDGDRILNSYPHELSGGMKQRVMIAMSLAGNPDLLVADEPTTATDATVQTQILDLLLEIQAKRGMSIIFISHDFRLIKKMCRYVHVMYCGKIVETQLTDELLKQPQHHYTKGLIDSRLSLKVAPKSRLTSIKGVVPPIEKWHKGCSFFERCEFSSPKCKLEEPPCVTTSDKARLACWFPVKR